MISKKRWHVKDKWMRHLGLVGNREVARHIPPTNILNRNSLNRYLKRYKVVFVKPVYGSYGNNIVKVARANDGFLFHREKRVFRVKPERIESMVLRHSGADRYLIQKGIQMLKLNGHPIDFRLLLLRPRRRWLVMGVMGKVAAGNRIVTNYNHGGRPIRFREALQSAGWSNDQIARTYREMTRIGLAAAETFANRYKHCRRMGIDFAVDTNKRLWILEVNTNPMYDLFRYHGNPNLHAQIARTMRVITRNQSDW